MLRTFAPRAESRELAAERKETGLDRNPTLRNYPLQSFMKKKCGIVLFIALLVVLMTACSEKENITGGNGDTIRPPALSVTPDIVINIPAFNEADFPREHIVQIDYRGRLVDAVSLSHFIDKALTDLHSGNATHETRSLFTYHIVGSDGFSPRNSRLDDLMWDVFRYGYIIPSEDFRSYFHRFDDNSANNYENKEDGKRGYLVRNVGTIQLFRSMIIENPRGDHILFHTNLLNTVKRPIVENDEDVILLSEFITKYITDTPERFSYSIGAVNGSLSDPALSWTQMQGAALVLTGSNRSRLESADPEVSLSGRQRLWNPAIISLVRVDE